jgi:hypothetical protein
MSIKKPPKTARRASKAERQRAQDVIDTFRVDNDLEPLYQALKHFAKEGTFAQTVDYRPQAARSIARMMKGAAFDEKVQVVVEHFNVSESTAARWLRKPALSNRDAD